MARPEHSTTTGPRRALGGLFVRREAWMPSRRGAALALAAFVLFAWGFVRGLYPFLALDRPVRSPVLVVDGWLPTVDVKEAARVFARGGYRSLLIVSPYYDYQSIDEDPGNVGMVSRILVRCGVPSFRIHPVIFPGVRKDRTYSSALAVGQWLRDQPDHPRSVDLATLAPHARRSRLLYRRGLGGDVSVGVVPLEDPAYDPARWWRFSEGVREVLFEGVAYVYARFFFSPR